MLSLVLCSSAFVAPLSPAMRQMSVVMHGGKGFGGGGAAPAAAAPAPAAAAASIPSGGSIDGAAYDDIWGIDWKIAVYNAWDPESPRTYTNFNPFERNDESAMCDTSGCFPGQSRGYKSPNRPATSWDIM